MEKLANGALVTPTPGPCLNKKTIFPGMGISMLTHWGTHICISKIIIIGSDNDLLPGGRQTIIWTNAGIIVN